MIITLIDIILFNALLNQLFFSFAVPTEPWSVEDLLDDDDIIDKVPLHKLQLLGINLTLYVSAHVLL